MATKKDKQVTEIVNAFGGAQFSDILNRLWLMGISTDTLKEALAKTSNGTNDPGDIVARLLNKTNPDGSPAVTADQLKQAPNVPVPAITGEAWPFQPDHKDPGGVVVPVHTNPLANYVSPQGQPLPAATPAVAPPPSLNIPQTSTPTAAPKVTNITNITNTPADTKKPTDTSTPAGVEKYQKENYSAMLWVKDVPDLAAKLKQAVQEKWTPGQFQAELEGTDWWKTHSDTVRAWTKLKADPPSYQQALTDHATLVKTMASTYGITLPDDKVNELADNWIKFGWDPKAAQAQVVNTATYDPNQGGALGAQVGAMKGLAKDYLLPMSDQDAWRYAQGIAAGTMTKDTVTGMLRESAKTSYPSLSEVIDKGGTPAQAMAGQISTAAQLLEIDPSQIDLTNPKYNQIVSHADEKGNIRPMTAYETSQFVKNQDDYWKTNNANKEVSGIVGKLGSIFGKTGL